MDCMGTRYNLSLSLSVSCGKVVVFTRYTGFHHQIKLTATI